jgi:hypothetical protein
MNVIAGRRFGGTLMAFRDENYGRNGSMKRVIAVLSILAAIGGVAPVE